MNETSGGVAADPFDTGRVVVSLDTEIAWGNIHVGEYARVSDRMDEGKAAIRKLIDAFERYEVPATWALVGQLFRRPERSPPPGSEPVLPDRQLPWDRDWWYAPELVDAIASSPVEHEIASHSANHLDYAGASRSEAAADLDLFGSLAAEYEPIRSFVFPRNRVAHLDLLREAGFICFRGRPPTLGADPSPTVFRPRLRGPLVDVPASTALRHYEHRPAVLRYFPTRLKGWFLKRGVDLAARTGAVFHVVLHPHDFTLEDGARLFREFETFLTYLAEKRDAGAVEPSTLVDVAVESKFSSVPSETRSV